MYKWHINSVIGRSRPLTNDFVRVADGIAASLRQFSISVARAEEAGERQPSKFQRGAEAAKEILPAPRGIDARSLAAKPQQRFTITRTRVSNIPGPGGIAPRAPRTGGYPGSRGSNAGGAGRGGGGMSRGRGGRGRGRGGRASNVRQPKRVEEDEDVIVPFNTEELTWMAGNDGGWPTPYVPQTNMEDLLNKGVSVISSPRGLLETAVYKMQVATNTINGPHRHVEDHIAKMKEGQGTLFESVAAKRVTQSQLGNSPKRKIPELPVKEREKLAQAWIAGHYETPVPADSADILRLVNSYTKRNETYLPADSRKLQAKLATLIPSLKPPPAPAPLRRPL